MCKYLDGLDDCSVRQIRDILAVSCTTPHGGIRPKALYKLKTAVGRALWCPSPSVPSNKNSISAIANLPVKQFMGAAKGGWGPYFRNLHNKMRKEATAHSPATRMNRPPPDRRRKPGQAPSPLRRRASSGARRPSQSTAYQQHNEAVDNSRQAMRNTITDNLSGRGTDGMTRRRRRQRGDGNNFDGWAASRAKAAKREAEEEVIGRMAMRLQGLWEELKIPSPDRAYVTATYLEAGGRGDGGDGDEGRGAKGNAGARGTSAPISVDVYHELVRQIRLLLEHRAATIQVK